MTKNRKRKGALRGCINPMISNIFRISILISCLCGAAKAEGTSASAFGFVFGSGLAQAPVRPEIKIETADYDYDYCLREISEEDATAPDAWNVKYDYDKIDGDFKWGLGNNSVGADIFMGGRISAYLFPVEILSKERKLCGVYFDDQLFLLVIDQRELSGPDYYLAKAAIEKKYGEAYRYGSSSICVSEWRDDRNKLSIQMVYSLAGSLTYYYAPLKAKVLLAWIDETKQHIRKSIE